MAGSYPDAPSRRMAWDEDGSIACHRAIADNDVLVELSSVQRASLNDENLTGVGLVSFTRKTYIIFPELREFDGIMAHASSTGRITEIGTSADTTNTWDGTWTTQIADLADTSVTLDAWRTTINSAAASNVRAIRIQYTISSGGGSNLTRVHLYGEIAAGETPDRLLFFDALTDLEFGLPIDYGDIPRGSASDRTFYLRNNSGTLTASSVQLTAESLYLNSGSWYTFNEGTGFQSTLPLASSIGPGADSPTITLRRVVPDSEQLGLHAGRVQASVGSWA